MSNAGFGQGPEKETVYGGSTPVATQGTVYSGFTPAGGQGTVYGTAVKTAEGTVYGGPTPGGTVYSGPTTGGISRPVSSAATGSSDGARKGARIFFLIAGLTAFRSILVYAGLQALSSSFPAVNGSILTTILLINLAIAGVFALLGVFTQKGSKIAFVTGMVLYAGDLALLLMSNPASHVVSIGIHALVLFYLFSAFRQLD
ncbi:MAG TPA: hypothetical protein VI488_01160 [Candidatus Angelobacter sp.]